MQRHSAAGFRQADDTLERTPEQVFAATARRARIRESRIRLYTLILAILAALGTLLVLVVFNARGQLHGAPLSVVAAPIMVTSLVDDLGSQVVVRQTVDEWAALRELDQGRSRAVLIVDLSTTRDTLVVPNGHDERAVAALVGRLRFAEALRGRSLVVRTREVAASAQTARSLVSVALVMGFLVAALVSLGRGATARRFHHRARTAAAVLMGVAALGAAGLAGWAPVLWLVVAVVMAVVLTLALEMLFGWTGFAVAAALCLTVVWPSALGVDPVFLPMWMQWGWHWSPTGSADSAVMSAMVYGGAGLVHHAVQMGAWVMGGLLALWLALARGTPHQLDGVASGRRRRISAIVVAFMIIVLAAVALAPESVGARPATLHLRSNRLSPCTPIPEVDSVADLNRIARLPGTSDFAGGDVGLDVTLQDGRTLWVFADTLRENAGMVRNSMLLADERCLRAVVPGDGGAVIPNRPRSAVGYWPMSAVRISLPGYDMVPVWAQRVHQRGSGVFGFETLGPSVAVFVVRPGEVPHLVAMKDLSGDAADLSRPMWGAASAMDGDWVYLYGTANRGDTLGFSVGVARVHIDDVLDPAALQYWDGFDWSDSPGSAAEVIPGAGGTSQTFSVFHQGDMWYAVSKQDEFLGSYLRVWIASTPTGPFYQGPVLAILPSELEAGHLVYMALAHPDVLPEDDSMVVSYSRNDVNLQHIVDDPTRYRPRFLRVWFP
jgi:hypothetical protein